MLTPRLRAVRAAAAPLMDFLEGPIYAGKRSADTPCDFVFGTPHEPVLPEYVAAVRRASVPGDPRWFGHSGSMASAKRAAARSLADRLGVPFEQDDLLLTKGASAALALVLQGVLAPEDEVVS